MITYKIDLTKKKVKSVIMADQKKKRGFLLSHVKNSKILLVVIIFIISYNEYTVWNFQKIPITQNFHEINFRDLRGKKKPATLAHSEAMNLDF